MTDMEHPSAGSGGPGTGPVLLNFKNHCLLCLQPQRLGTVLDIIRNNPKKLRNFQPIIHYLTGTDPIHARSQDECWRKGIPVMANLPPMCPPCYDLLAGLYGLHEQLLEVQGMIQKKTEMAREVVTTARMVVPVPGERLSCAPRRLSSSSRSSMTLASSPRQEFYSRVLSSGMSKEEVDAVTEFVDNLHDKIITEATGKKTVIFPGGTVVPSDPVSHPSHEEEVGDQFTPEPKPGQDRDPSTSAPMNLDVTVAQSVSNLSIAFPASSSPSVDIVDGNPAHPKVLGETVEPRERSAIDLPDSDEGDDIKSEVPDEEVVDGDDGFENVAENENDPGRDNKICYDDNDDGDADFQVLSPELESSMSSFPSSSSSESEPASPKVAKRKRKQKQIKSGYVSGEGPPPPPPKIAKSILDRPTPTPRASRRSRTTRDPKSNSDKPRTRSKRVENRVRARPLLVRPLVSTDEGTSQYCDLCGVLFPSSQIETHLDTQHHVKDFIAKCPNPSCPYVFSCRGKLDKHLRNPNDKFECLKAANISILLPLMNCSICPFKTKSRYSLRTHLHSHESEMDDSTKSPCPITDCPERFGLKQSMEDHLFTHDEEYELRRPKYKKKELGTPVQRCDLCNKSIPILRMEAHLGEGHNVKEYITKCLNPACPRVFFCREKMLGHLSASIKCRSVLEPYPIPLKCDSCGFETTSRFSFRLHIKQHESRLKVKTILCPIEGCHEQFALREAVQEHLITHDKRPTRTKDNLSVEVAQQKCSVCQAIIKVEDAANHFSSAHPAMMETLLQCKYCPFLFPTSESLLDHLYVHRTGATASGGVACHLCDDSTGAKFVFYESLRQHYFNVHQIGQQFLCEECDMEFFSQQRLTLHKKNSHSIDGNPEKKKYAKRFKCETCGPEVAFYQWEGLLSHQIKFHDAPPPTCKFCDKTFLSPHQLRFHEASHLGIGRTYKCRVEGCGKVYTNMTMRRRHELGSHNPNPDSKLFICDTCGKGYNSRGSLRGHTNRIHLGKKEQRRICELCVESFASRETLRTHKLIHTEERPHKCSECNQAFRHRSVLLTHLKGHQEKGDNFKPNGPMKHIRKRVNANNE